MAIRECFIAAQIAYGSPVGYVENLNTPTDSHNGHIPGQCAADEPDLELVPLDSLPRNAEERVALIRDAHVRLCDLDEKNRVKFGAFLDLLAREIGPEPGS